MTIGGVLIGKFDLLPRLRVAKPGFDVRDPELTNEQLAFDSQWPEILSVLKASWLTSGTTQTEVYSADGVSYTRYYRTVMLDEPLPFEPICIGWTAGVNSSGQRSYLQMPACSYTDRCTFTLVNPTNDIAYMIFANPLTAADAREADNGGSNGVLVGRHPTRGLGLFVSRKGANVKTCPSADLRLTSERPVFQVAECGVFWGTPSGGSISRTVSLQGVYHDTPPVIILANENRTSAPGRTGPTISWVDASTITIKVPSNVAQSVQFFIPAYDPTYVPGPSSAVTPRVRADLTSGLKISRKNVDVNTATGNNLLFDASRSALHVTERVAINSPGIATNSKVQLASKTVGPALGVFGAFHLSRWWCTFGGIDMQQAARATPSSLPPASSINYQLMSWINKDKTLRATWQAGHATPNLRVAVIEHSAAVLNNDVIYTGPASQSESLYDDFSGATAGSAPPGWTRRYQTATGLNVATNAVASALTGKAIRVTGGFGSPTASTFAEISFDAPGSGVTNCDILAGARMINGPIVYPFEIMYRRSASNVHQAAGLVCDVSSGVASGQRMWFGPTYSNASGSVDYPWLYDTWYWIRLNVRGDQRRMKVWQRGTPEPKNWDIAFVGPGSAAGYVGLTQWASNTAYAYMDFFSVCTTGRPAWGPL